MIKYNNRTKKIRVGNDFICFWYIRRSSRPEDIINATDIVLTATNGDRVIPLEFSVVDTDTLKIEVKTDWADELGDYVFTVSYVLTDPSFSDDMRANKINKRAFKIVPKSEQANTYLELHLTSEVLTGFRGDPFEYDDFTQEQLAAIQQPILDFVVLAEDAEANREDKEADRRRYENSRKLSESDRVTKELERLEAESTRITQESTRETAEGIRKDNEQDRVTAEDLRLLAEPLRISQENDRKSNENIRITSEENRIEAEDDRILNELDRVLSEDARSDVEAGRKRAETKRESNEAIRINKEFIRDNSENDRDSAEVTRASNETTREIREGKRVSNESNRVLTENDRASQEVIRKSNEAERLINEGIRKSGEEGRESTENIRRDNETNRKDAEISRKSKETIRESNETTRINKETIRISNESGRVDAEIVREQQEEARQTNTATAITNAENAITDVNTAKDDYYDVVKPDIIAQGEYATAQGDYAKAQGEAIQDDLALKANHGYESNPKTLKEVEDDAKDKIEGFFEEDIERKISSGLDVILENDDFDNYEVILERRTIQVLDSIGNHYTYRTYSSSSNTIKIPIKNVSRVDISLFTSTSGYGAAFVDKNGIVLLGIYNPDATEIKTSLVPENATHLLYPVGGSTTPYIKLYSGNSLRCDIDYENIITHGGEVILDSNDKFYPLSQQGQWDLKDINIGDDFIDILVNSTIGSSIRYKSFLVHVKGFKTIQYFPVRTSYQYGSMFIDKNNKVVGTHFEPITSIPIGITDEIAIPEGAVYFVYAAIGDRDTNYVKLSRVIEKPTIPIDSKKTVQSHLILLEQGVVSSSGNIIENMEVVTTSEILGGKGFHLQLSDGYEIHSAHMYSVDTNELVHLNYLPPKDYNSTPFNYDDRNSYMSNMILPQYYLKVCINKKDGSEILHTESIIKSFCYLDSPSLRKIIPENDSYIKVQKRLKQMSNILWTPKVNVISSPPSTGVPTSKYFFKTGVTINGLPYSDVAEHSKYVGQHVSFKTFLSAVNNKRSLLYTESLSSKTSKYGITYAGGGNIANSYYGTVCSGLTGYIAGLDEVFLSYNYATISGMSIINNPNSDNVEILDFVWNSGHISIITDIIVDIYGKRRFIVWTEMTKPTPYITPYPTELFDKRLIEKECKVYRYSKWSELEDADDTPFIQTDLFDYPQQLKYNNDICTFAGDYATFSEDDIIFLNLNRKEYTNLEIYKNDSLAHNIDISSMPSDDLYPEDEEDWVKFEVTTLNLEYGKYKARLTGSTNSDYTYFEILDTTFTAVEDGEVTNTTFSSENGVPYLIEQQQPTGFASGRYKVTQEDINSGTAVVNWISTDYYPYIKIFVRGDYGVAVRRIKMYI